MIQNRTNSNPNLSADFSTSAKVQINITRTKSGLNREGVGEEPEPPFLKIADIFPRTDPLPDPRNPPKRAQRVSNI